MTPFLPANAAPVPEMPIKSPTAKFGMFHGGDVVDDVAAQRVVPSDEIKKRVYEDTDFVGLK